MQILILGREKLLCRAEAIAVFGSANLLNDDVVKLPDDAKVDINMLGGAIKSGRVIKQNINKNPISLQAEISNFRKTPKASLVSVLATTVNTRWLWPRLALS